VKTALLGIVLASILSVAACSDDTPTSPTQPGPQVTAVSTVTESGRVFQPLARSGPDSINLTFRLSDFTVVHADANTMVRNGAVNTNTTAVRLGQAVTVTGVPRNGFVQATLIVIN
jgi:hypothetical protein